MTELQDLEMAKKKQSMTEYIKSLQSQQAIDKKFCMGCFSRDGITTITVKEHLHHGWIFNGNVPKPDFVTIITTDEEGKETKEVKHFVNVPCHFCNKKGRLSLSSVASNLYETDIGQGLKSFILMKDVDVDDEGLMVPNKYNAFKGLDGKFDMLDKKAFAKYVRSVIPLSVE